MESLLKLNLIALSLLICVESLAANEPSEDIQTLDTITVAKPIDRQPPDYPVSAARNKKEGWAVVSFVVDKEGNVIDPILEGSSGVSAFEKASLRAVSKWKYSPAEMNGEKIEQCKTRVRIDFRFPDSDGVSRRFRSRYQDTLREISEGNLDRASDLISELETAKKRTWDENGYLWIAKAYYHEARGEVSKYKSALVKLHTHKQGGISNDLYFAMLQKLYVVYLKENRLAEAQSLFDEIANIAPEHPTTLALKSYDEKVNEIVLGNELIQVNGDIQSSKGWSYRLARNQFEIEVQNGVLDKVEIRCDNKRASYTSVKQHNFTIPKSWGQCTVFADGQQDTQFSLFELAQTS